MHAHPHTHMHTHTYTQEEDGKNKTKTEWTVTRSNTLDFTQQALDVDVDVAPLTTLLHVIEGHWGVGVAETLVGASHVTQVALADGPPQDADADDGADDEEKEGDAHSQPHRQTMGLCDRGATRC